MTSLDEYISSLLQLPCTLSNPFNSSPEIIYNNTKVNGRIHSCLNIKVLIKEHTNLLQADYPFSFFEDYFSSAYVQHYLFEISESIEKNQSPEKISKECKEICEQLFNYPFFWKGPLHDKYIHYQTQISNELISEFSSIPLVASLVNIFQEEANYLNSSLYDSIQNTEIGADAIVSVLKDHLYFMSDTDYIRGKLLQKFASNSQSTYQKKLEKLIIISSICDLIISEISSFNDKSLKSFIKSQKNEDMYTQIYTDNSEIHSEQIRSILNKLKSQNMRCLESCHEKLGTYSTI